MTASSSTLDVTPTLTALDRCDRCGAQAYIRAVLASGGALIFCNHHGRDVEASLRPQTVEWIDESARIN
ncbi:DUF7455 domain-containing protein [Nesterenkonia sphaerica]|uniref:DUF7455 domain-containing protein n=1 Tax=Nesterenkonia sphaerica TaxID=1804988 RepID=A0A5R9AN10_9MICC|nr:hypothetical protein [Nesterenkonia sphaerica]TLP79524.1 hypothetical protein FEF27_02745 [Nesterenkonia sphaerica]